MLGASRTFATFFAFPTKVRKNSSEESNEKSEDFFSPTWRFEIFHVAIRLRPLSAPSILGQHRTSCSFFCTFAPDEWKEASLDTSLRQTQMRSLPS